MTEPVPAEVDPDLLADEEEAAADEPSPPAEVPDEADPADVAEQHAEVPVLDEEEYR